MNLKYDFTFETGSTLHTNQGQRAVIHL